MVDHFHQSPAFLLRQEQGLSSHFELHAWMASADGNFNWQEGFTLRCVKMSRQMRSLLPSSGSADN